MHNRAFIEISGSDRVTFLQGLLTQDVTKLTDIQFAAMLSPQGKILHDMFLVAVNSPLGGESERHLSAPVGGVILLDTPAIHAATLLRRLTMYKLRAKVAIRDASAEWHVMLGEDGLPDPRHAELQWRRYERVIPAKAGIQSEETFFPAQTRLVLDSRLRGNDTIHRQLTLGIPDSSVDFAPDEITAMDAGYDLLNAISFTKGCYVGQEVTARMQYKNIARKGFFVIASDVLLQPGAALMIGDKNVGNLRSVSGTMALAFLKFEDALSGAEATVNHRPVRLSAPGWMLPKITQFKATKEKQ